MTVTWLCRFMSAIDGSLVADDALLLMRDDVGAAEARGQIAEGAGRAEARMTLHARQGTKKCLPGATEPHWCSRLAASAWSQHATCALVQPHAPCSMLSAELHAVNWRGVCDEAVAAEGLCRALTSKSSGLMTCVVSGSTDGADGAERPVSGG